MQRNGGTSRKSYRVFGAFSWSLCSLSGPYSFGQRYRIQVEEALEAYEEEETPENHALVMEGRRRRLEELCKKFEVEARIEHSSLFHRSEPINRCTGRFFKFQEKDFFICNVLKGGSTSWSFFFGENNITAAFIADCRESGSCPEKPELRLLQVRHPLERLLATWRHLFKNGGWKSLDGVASTKPEAKKEMEKTKAGFTWNYF